MNYMIQLVQIIKYGVYQMKISNPYFFFNTTFDWLNLYAGSRKAT